MQKLVSYKYVMQKHLPLEDTALLHWADFLKPF